MTFAENIKQARQRVFLSQDAFAKILDVNFTTVSRWETGRSKTNLSTMKKIKKFCKDNGVDYAPLEVSWLAFKN